MAGVTVERKSPAKECILSVGVALTQRSHLQQRTLLTRMMCIKYPIGKSTSKKRAIDATKFTMSQCTITSKWKTTPNGGKDGLDIHSDDLFSPSIESPATRCRHVVRHPIPCDTPSLCQIMLSYTTNYRFGSCCFEHVWEFMRHHRVFLI